VRGLGAFPILFSHQSNLLVSRVICGTLQVCHWLKSLGSTGADSSDVLLGDQFRRGHVASFAFL
jgi:hypothetical protein